MPWWEGEGEADARAGEATAAEFLRTKFVLLFIVSSSRDFSKKNNYIVQMSTEYFSSHSKSTVQISTTSD
jgi:hypothetical protein